MVYSRSVLILIMFDASYCVDRGRGRTVNHGGGRLSGTRHGSGRSETPQSHTHGSNEHWTETLKDNILIY